jgi:phenylpyruvate tautomerase PptA (4-oxalocrotonate tautomerase family)
MLKIRTNQALDAEAAQTLLREASSAVAQMLGKPEQYVMVDVQGGCAMSFAGSTDPLAYLELKSIGLHAGQTAEFSARLCELVSTHLGVPGERTYIEFADAARHLWGWNGATF